MKRILSIFGTRPEAIKMAPVIAALKRRPEFDSKVCVTAQHRGLLDQVLQLFAIGADFDLDIMERSQSLGDITARVITGLEPVLRRTRPDLVLVHGDTTTTLAGALAAFYHRIPVGHVEAGLRTRDRENPFPEEINRRLTDNLATLHFAPTREARSNLLREGHPAKGIFVTGNTGIDALLEVVRQDPAPPAGKPLPERFILVTAHRRENFGKPLAEIFAAIASVARRNPSLSFIYPVHPNPQVRGPARRILGGLKNVSLLSPLDYSSMVALLRRADFILTDSGGIQEEAPSLGKPVLVLRDATERPEAVAAGTVRLVGRRRRTIEQWLERLLADRKLHGRMARAVNPYGDGKAAGRTVEAIRYFFQLRYRPPAAFKPLSTVK